MTRRILGCLALLHLCLLQLCLWTTLTAEEKRVPRPRTMAGVLAKVKDNTLTLTLRGDAGERTETFVLAKDAVVKIESQEDETVKVKGEGGNERTINRPKVIDAKLADLKVGQRVSVTFIQEKEGADKNAQKVLGHRAAKPRKEGDRKEGQLN
jgi:hypothetical protein